MSTMTSRTPSTRSSNVHPARAAHGVHETVHETFEPLQASLRAEPAGVAPPLRMPYLVSGRGSMPARQLAKAVPVLEAQWTQELHDGRRAGRSVAYFQQRKQDLRRAIDLELGDGYRGETPLAAAYRRLVLVINGILKDMPHVLNKVEGKRLRQLCQQYGEKPEVLLRRPEIRAMLQTVTETASRAKPQRERRLKGPVQAWPSSARKPSRLLRHGLDD